MITDWDDAYAVAVHIEGAEEYFTAWERNAEAFRDETIKTGQAVLDVAYGDGERERFDLFQPNPNPDGLAIFVHGGYWMRLDKNSFSHMAKGAFRRGWAVAVPSYDLTPNIRVSGITKQIGTAIEKAASMVAGPIHIAGHSAGGHLVSRMVCADGPLSNANRERLKRVLSISGLHDLRPLLKTEMNNTLNLDAEEARAESASLNEPLPGKRIVCWVGANEGSEFIRQTDLLANIWSGLGVETSATHGADKHHFDVIDGLTDPASPLAESFLG